MSTALYKHHQEVSIFMLASNINFYLSVLCVFQLLAFTECHSLPKRPKLKVWCVNLLKSSWLVWFSNGLLEKICVLWGSKMLLFVCLVRYGISHSWYFVAAVLSVIRNARFSSSLLFFNSIVIDKRLAIVKWQICAIN